MFVSRDSSLLTVYRLNINSTQNYPTWCCRNMTGIMPKMEYDNRQYFIWKF